MITVEALSKPPSPSMPLSVKPPSGVSEIKQAPPGCLIEILWYAFQRPFGSNQLIFSNQDTDKQMDIH